jgi:hypothetical protein
MKIPSFEPRTGRTPRAVTSSVVCENGPVESS